MENIMFTKNRKEFSKIAGIYLSCAILLGQAQAMENIPEHIYKADHHMRTNILLLEPLSGYLNAQDLLKLRQTCKAYSCRIDGLYLYYKHEILHREPFKIYEQNLENLNGLNFVKKVAIIQKSMEKEESDESFITSYHGPLSIGLISGAIIFFVYYNFINND
jgi:hypothetical protein